MVIIKSPFPLILCCYLLVSFVFFPQGTVSRKLLGEEGGNGPSKAGVRKSKSQPAPSWGGQGSHPAASNQVSRTSSSPSRTKVPLSQHGSSLFSISCFASC
ncbi:hypothetical protein V6Z12_D13G030400 [Gossypium hirsutum]